MADPDTESWFVTIDRPRSPSTGRVCSSPSGMARVSGGPTDARARACRQETHKYPGCCSTPLDCTK
jgi:hypothetical protein